MEPKKLELNNKSTSEFAVSRFFEGWKNRDFKEVNKYIQKTWLTNSQKDEFEKGLGHLELKDYHIYDKEVITDCREEIDFRADILFKGKIKNMYGKVNVICENAPYQPNPKGEWGINPISLLRWRT